MNKFKKLCSEAILNQKMLGCPLMVQRHALVLLLRSACWLRPCSVEHVKQQCSHDDLFQLLAHAS